RLSGRGIELPRPLQLVHILAAFDEAAFVAIERIKESVAAEMADRLAALAIDRDVVKEVDADLIIVPRVVRQILVVPDELAGVDIKSHRGVGAEIVARARHRIVFRNRVAAAPDAELGRRITRAGLPEPTAAGLPG